MIVSQDLAQMVLLIVLVEYFEIRNKRQEIVRKKGNSKSIVSNAKTKEPCLYVESVYSKSDCPIQTLLCGFFSTEYFEIKNVQSFLLYQFTRSRS